VTVACKPEGGGTFNTTSASQEEGGNVRLYAYTNTGYQFLRWENENGDTLSMAQEFYYVIPHGNSKVYGIFEFNPANPANPHKNYWNKELGEVIVDDFTAGSLGSAVSEVISGSNRSDVTMIIVAGRMNSNDFGIANNYTNCTLLDLSRVTGITEVPSYAFDNTNLESVYLPATIERIGARAFYGCSRLSSLTIYAMTPPTLESNVFTNVPEGLVVYVPAAALAQYQEAEGWKNFTLLPIQEDIRELTVNLPENVQASDFAKMWLELTNTKSGQRMHYVTTDHTTYTFHNIIKNTSWNVVLRNERGDVFGQIDEVEVKEEDLTITFPSLSKPQGVSLVVMTPNGNDVTEQTEVTWTDASGNYMAQGTSLTGLPIGFQLNYQVGLSQELAMTYLAPHPTEYILKDGSNDVVCLLQPIAQVQMSGKVKDGVTGLPLADAIVSASQTFGGKYGKTLNAKTDRNGTFTLDIANVPTTMGFAATDYVSQTMVCDSLMDGKTALALPDVSLHPITGATVSIEFTYTSVDGETVNWYTDYQNVDYALFNVTKNRDITQYNVQYPQIVLMEEVADGDVIRLTATSRTNAFMPVTSTVTVSDQRATASFGITELGKIQASFTRTDNAAVVGTLYDAAGKLVRTYDYYNASLTISGLADGQYTLVSMGTSDFFNTIYDLAQLPQTGLAVGTDYVQHTVEVKSGAVSIISIDEVPTLNESKLYYTGDNTSFTVNKSSIVVGNYLTLTGRIDFKPAYATTVSNVQMIVDLPEEYSFVENSVMVGNNTSNYSLNGTRLSIPLTYYTDRVRFCVIPTIGGNYAPSAFAQFELDDETIMQPIGSALSEIKNIEIIVPSSTANEQFRVSGKAESRSSVSIYLDDILVSNVVANAAGDWSTECQLIEPQNFSAHYVYAVFEKASRPTLISETKEIVFNPLDVHVNNVEMTFLNGWNKKQYSVIWDFVNRTTNCKKYDFYTETDMTFLIDIAYHDTKLIPFVWLHVHTSDGKVRSLRAEYDETKDRWIAIDRFSSSSLPTNVSVTIENMVFDPSAEVSYELLMDEYVGDINLKETIEEPNGSSTSIYTDGNGDNIASITSFASNLPVAQLVEKYKQEGFEEDELIDDESDYIPENEDDILDNDIKVLTDSKTGSLALFGSEKDSTYVVIIRIIREEDKQSSTSLVSSTITRRWKSFYKSYFDEANCVYVTVYKRYTEHLDKYVTIITSTLVAHAVFIDYRKLPPGTKIPSKQVIAKLRRIRHSSKRYTTWTTEYTSVPGDCPPPPDPPTPPTPPTPPVEPIHDPSGFVYEGVTSNRLEGVTATAFYKETVEDMYGDLHENVMKWDAEEYAQENPLFTDEDGMYRWDVPQGLWQVKFEKEGYETTYSDWLPVPPPQLDINVAMKQNRQPEVKMARAFEDAVEVDFDKYMMPELLTTDNIMVLQNGTAVEGTIELLNEEVSYEGEEETFASKVRFNAAQPFTEKEVTLIVTNRVKSYAGIRMQDDYQQTFAIEQEIKQIVCDSLLSIGYGKSKTMTVTVLPASASQGKTLYVTLSSSMIIGTETNQVTIGSDGTAQITVTGELPGTAALTFSVNGTDKTAMTIANVEHVIYKTVAMPTTSIASGTLVDMGTLITLSCATEGAIIYYTLDGSCPCDESANRFIYDGTPIVINGNVTIKAMAVIPGMSESDVAEFVYTVDGIEEVTWNDKIQVYPLPLRHKVNVKASGKTIKSVTISSMNGMVVA
ncbi:MAG: chitobiase/beta-hexosaminidase C-terminal domain-containing protein, partial [Muribaculaceae bacterium]|nr:chitobiase/beta-hexosaminidase C-terminal domain-containing protein [Muribaculaceae bacterium]